MLDVCGVTKSFGDVRALDGVDLTVAPGEICALLGPNGAGKTTLVSLVVGLLQPDEGRVLVGGADVRDAGRETRRLIGYAPQELGIYAAADVRSNLRLFGELAGLRRSALRERIAHVAAALGLDQLMDRTAGELSGGQQRRVHAAMALMNRPRLVLLDEPTVAADVQTRAALLGFVRRLVEEGAAVVYSTHYLQEVEDLDAGVVVLDRGRVIEQAPVRRLLAEHGDTVVELSFDGDAPDVPIDGAARSGDTLVLTGDEPRSAIASVLSRLPTDGPRLVGVDIVRPSLDSVFLTLTGHRAGGDAPGVTDAA